MVAVKPPFKFTPRERVVLLVVGVAALALLVLRFPFDGYWTNCPYQTTLTEACEAGLRESGEGEASARHWYSRAALVEALRPLSRLLLWEGSVAVVTAAALVARLEMGEAKPSP